MIAARTYGAWFITHLCFCCACEYASGATSATWRVYDKIQSGENSTQQIPITNPPCSLVAAREQANGGANSKRVSGKYRFVNRLSVAVFEVQENTAR